ncbi:MAG: hypothetical protein KDD82_30225, partial [Planctomycetes bacterium]|nr:hypothetical protein [Planctomycetota bacterium]
GLPPFAGRNVVLRALSPQPEQRPPLEALVRALELPTQPAAARAGSGTNPFVVLLLLLGGMFVLSGALGLVGFGLAMFGQFGRLLLVGALTVLLGLGGWVLERSFPNTGFALQLLANRLLWAVAGLGFALEDLADEEGPWFAASAAIFLVTYGIACRRGSTLFAVAAVPDAWIAAGFLGSLLSTGSLTGAAIYSTLVALALIGVAALGQTLAGPRVGVPLWVGALAALWVGVGLSVGLVHDEPLFGTLWLALVLALHAPPIAFAASPYRWIAAGDLLALLAWVPTTVALVQAEQLAFLQLTLLLGAAVVSVAFRAPQLATRPELRLLTVLTGLASTCVGPAALCLYRCSGTSGWALLRGGLESAGRVHETLWVYVAMVLGVSAALVGLGFLFAKDAQRKLEYRLLEVAGALLFFGTFTALSLASYQDTFYPLGVLVGGSALLALGVTQKRAALTVVTVGAMTLNVWIQYFAQLSEFLPVWLLSLGFGLALLGCGLVYERKLKRDVLPQLGAWR